MTISAFARNDDHVLNLGYRRCADQRGSISGLAEAVVLRNRMLNQHVGLQE